MIVASGLSNVDYDYIPRRDVAEEDLVHDGRFIAVLANACLLYTSPSPRDS